MDCLRASGYRGSEPVARNPLDSRWGSGASLAFNFLAGPLHPALTFTRASPATFVDSAGVLQTAGNNVARFDFDPATLQPRGLLIEESRTNSIRNGNAVGSSAGTPGTPPTNWFSNNNGLTRQIVGSGVERGIPYIDVRFSGTPAATADALLVFESTSQIAAAQGQAWSISFYLALVAGSFTNVSVVRLRIDEYAAGPTFLTVNGSNISLGSIGATMSRFVANLTIGQATAATIGPGIGFSLTAGQAVDFTIRIGATQLEQGAFATSYIPTTSVAVTRAAEVCRMPSSSIPGFSATEGALVAESIAGTVAVSCSVAGLSPTGTENSRISLGHDLTTGNVHAFVADSGVTQVNQAGVGAVSVGTAVRTAIAWRAADFAVARAGTAATAAAGTVPAVDSLNIGRRSDVAGAGGPFNGWIRRIAYYPRRLSNAQLQALTA